MASKRHVLWLVLAAVICDYAFVTMMRVCLPFHAKALGGSSTMILYPPWELFFLLFLFV